MSELQALIQARQRASSGSGRRLRQSAGLSLRELADQIGVDAATLDRWERGESRPRRDAALKYGSALAAIETALDSGDEW